MPRVRKLRHQILTPRDLERRGYKPAEVITRNRNTTNYKDYEREMHLPAFKAKEIKRYGYKNPSKGIDFPDVEDVKFIRRGKDSFMMYVKPAQTSDEEVKFVEEKAAEAERIMKYREKLGQPLTRLGFPAKGIKRVKDQREKREVPENPNTRRVFKKHDAFFEGGTLYFPNKGLPRKVVRGQGWYGEPNRHSNAARRGWKERRR